MFVRGHGPGDAHVRIDDGTKEGHAIDISGKDVEVLDDILTRFSYCSGD